MKPATVTRRMGSNRDQLKDDILRLAVECKVTSGKVSSHIKLFIFSIVFVPHALFVSLIQNSLLMTIDTPRFRHLWLLLVVS